MKKNIFTSILVTILICSFANAYYFFPTDLQPAPTGMYLCKTPLFGSYPASAMGAIQIRKFCNRVFSSNLPPPLPGLPWTNTFTGMAEFEISYDNGSTWTAMEIPITEALRMEFISGVGSTITYSIEMVSMDISGGGLPTNYIIRESPTLSSSGTVTVTPTAGGYTISSFFNICTELSIDGGAWWYPTTQIGYMEQKLDPQVIAPIMTSSNNLPPPNCKYVSTIEPWQIYGGPVIIKNLELKLPTGWQLPPAFGSTQTQTFDGQADFWCAVGGGAYTKMRAPYTMTFSISNIREFSGKTIYELQVSQLDIMGGDLPLAILIRESPSMVSQGSICVIVGGNNETKLYSFFDIFTEISTDGGFSYFPAGNGPGHLEAQIIGSEINFASNYMPPLQGEYYSLQPTMPFALSSVVLSNFNMRQFTMSSPLPAPGAAAPISFSTNAKLLVSLDNGGTFSRVVVPASVTMNVIHRLGGDGVTEYYDAEIVSMNILTGLPSGMMIRESPTRASLGRFSQRYENPIYHINSFFDIFLEVSLDSGMTWQPMSEKPWTIILRHDSCNTCANFNGWGLIDMFDFNTFAPNWRWKETPGDATNIADLDCDGDVDMSDLAVISAGWLGTCY